MSDAIEGGCRCGRIRYQVVAQELPNAYACHCRDCQTWSGSAFAMAFVTLEERFEVQGDPALFELTSPGGERTSRQRACPVCFTRIFNTNTARPGLVVVRAGTLDRSDELKIVAHIWTKRKVQGIDLASGVPAWPEGPPMPQFMTALVVQAPKPT
jgi:hypothetical protein